MKFKLKDPGSAITHGIALLLAAVGAVPLIIKAARSYDVLHIVALSIFILTMVLLYAASTIYHSVDSTEKVNRRLRKMDHMMIFWECMEDWNKCQYTQPAHGDIQYRGQPFGTGNPTAL